jgi:hypothetical protein
MSKAKIATAVSVLAIGVAIYEGSLVQTQSRRVQAAERRAQAALDQLTTERAALASATQRLQAADEDNARLLSAIARAGQSFSSATSDGDRPAKYSRADVMKRFEHAQKLVVEKDYEGALKEYLWCLDVGMLGFGFIVERRERLPDKLKELIQIYPAAGALLRQRRGEALEQLLADNQDTEALAGFMALTKALNDPSALIDAINRLPAGDARKDALLVGDGYNLLLEQRNYGAIAAVRSYEKMASALEMGSVLVKSPAVDPKVLPRLREGFIKFAVSDVEVLLGAGREEDARQLASKLLAFDSSATTRAQLVEQAKRAGKPDWQPPKT